MDAHPPLAAALESASPHLRPILERALEGRALSTAEALPLMEASGADLHALAAVADALRARQVGDVVSYVVNRNINFTNVCIKHCGFCAFSRDHHAGEGYFLDVEEVVRRAAEAAAVGATEVCIQAGLAPGMRGDFYVDLCRALKKALPEIHIHAFSPEEVLYGATRARLSIEEYLRALKEAGLGSLPGTSAEILDDALRDVIARGRISTAQWLEVITTAHQLGIRTTATMMYGHVETPAHVVAHLDLLRRVQEETGGFTEFVPLSFIAEDAPMWRERSVPGVRRGATGNEVIRVHALARILLGPSVRNVQVSWVKEGLKMSQWLLACGANDLGGTLINESISTTAGAGYGQLVAPAELRRLIRDAGRVPAERTALYHLRRVYEREGDDERSPLDEVQDAEARFGSYARLAGSTEHRFVLPTLPPRPRAGDAGGG
jgi:FO synthase subunit 2